jgi:hypothetical protein
MRTRIWQPGATAKGMFCARALDETVAPPSNVLLRFVWSVCTLFNKSRGAQCCKTPSKQIGAIACTKFWSRSYDRELQRQRCKKNYSATGSLVRFENKVIFFYFEKTLEPTTTLALYLDVNSKVGGLAPEVKLRAYVDT